MTALSEKIEEISTHQIVTSTKVEGLEEKVSCLDTKVGGIKEDIVAVKTDTSWIKKILSIMLAAIVGGMLTLGGKMVFENVPSPAMAQSANHETTTP